MSEKPGLDQPAVYQIRLQGVLSADWQDWLDGFQIRTDGNVTILSGLVVDQPALFGLLIKIRNLGLTVLSVKRLDNQTANRPDDPAAVLPKE